MSVFESMINNPTQLCVTIYLTIMVLHSIKKTLTATKKLDKNIKYCTLIGKKENAKIGKQNVKIELLKLKYYFI